LVVRKKEYILREQCEEGAGGGGGGGRVLSFGLKATAWSQ